MANDTGGPGKPSSVAEAIDAVEAAYDFMLAFAAQGRERDVYPTMAGYRKPRPEAQAIKLPVKLPEQLRGEQVRNSHAPTRGHGSSRIRPQRHLAGFVTDTMSRV